MWPEGNCGLGLPLLDQIWVITILGIRFVSDHNSGNLRFVIADHFSSPQHGRFSIRAVLWPIINVTPAFYSWLFCMSLNIPVPYSYQSDVGALKYYLSIYYLVA